MTTAKSKSRKELEKIVGEPMSVSLLLRSNRFCEELSQKDFAKRLGVSVANLCDIEKGRQLVSPQRAARFAEALGLSEKQFVRVALQDILRKQGFENFEVHLVTQNRRHRRAA